MAAITDLSALINRATGGNSGTPENLFFTKSPRVGGAAAAANIAGRPQSLWQYDGNPAAGAAPTTGVIPVNDTAGGLLQTDPSGGRQKWLYGISVAPSVAGTLILYDRLFHVGGLSGTSVAAQNVQGTSPSPVLTRYTDGIGNIAFVEIHTQIGASSTTISMSYVDQADADSTSPGAVIGNTGFREIQRAIVLPMASGDTAIKAVKTVTLAGTTGTAGSFGVVIGHPIAFLGAAGPGVPSWRDFSTGLPGIPEIKTDACLALLWMPGSTTAPEVFGTLSMLEA